MNLRAHTRKLLIFISFILLSQITLIAAAKNQEAEVDHLGRPLWEEGAIWVKVKAEPQSDLRQTAPQVFDKPSLNEKVRRFDVREIQRAFKVKPSLQRDDLPDLTRIFTLKTSYNTDVRGLLSALNNDPNVEYAERIPAMYQDDAPNDEFYSTIQYHLPQIQAEEAWGIHKGENGTEEIVIGICDSGIDWKHPDLAPNIYNRLGEDADGDGVTILFDGTEWIMDPDDLNGVDDDGNGYIDDLIGWNMMADAQGSQNNNPMDPPNRGHGTHCAGLSAGVTNNTIGIAAISWNVKVFGTSHSYEEDGGEYIFRSREGLIYLAENGADIINASWGGGGYSKTDEEIARYLSGLGVLLVSSAGNGDDGAGGMTGFGNEYPSSYPGVISVAAVAKDDTKAWYSTFGPGVDIAAPGGNHEPGLYSTLPRSQESYGYKSGTSMASPLTAGLFGLVKSYHPDWTNDQLINQVLATADNIDSKNGSYIDWLGSGRINAFRALSETDVSLPAQLELVQFDMVLSNGANHAFPGDTVSVHYTIRNFSHLIGDSSVSFTLVNDDPDVSIITPIVIDTVFADEFAEIGPFTFVIAEATTTHETDFVLNITSPTSVIYGDDIGFSLQVITVRPAADALNLSMTFGDSLTADVELINSGTADVNISAHILTRQEGEAYFHLDDHLAFDGVSWWAGNSSTGTYDNNTLDFLDVSIGDLSTSSSPLLTFKTQWSMEFPGGEPVGFDGWDGANVWVSTDGGASFSVLTPNSPAYTVTSLYAFGEWNYGKGIPGWAGVSDGYQDAEFDLSEYITDNVVIRFTLASDPFTNAGGFWVDDILVADGATTIYQNDGAENSTTKTYGFQGGLVVPGWVSLPEENHTISANSNLIFPANINSRTLEPGSYSAFLQAENDSGFVLTELDVNLVLEAPDHDVAVLDYSVSNDGFRVLRTDSIQTHLVNYGKLDESNIAAALSLSANNVVIFKDTVEIASLTSGEMIEVVFAPYYPLSYQELSVKIDVVDVTNDYNAWNDAIESIEIATNLVDDFTEVNDLWIMDGWSLSRNDLGHLDFISASADSGYVPYRPNQDNYMTFKKAIDLTRVDNLAIVFWTISQTEENVDITTFEVSTDGTTWEVLRSISGTNLVWSQHAVDVSEYISNGFDQLWFRFHFVSNDAGQGLGMFVDEVALHTTTLLGSESPLAVLPREFVLNQNYPNPFNPSTTIKFGLPERSDVELVIFNLKGQEVATLIDDKRSAGWHTMVWNGMDYGAKQVPTGVYFARLKAGSHAKVIKMLYLK